MEYLTISYYFYKFGLDNLIREYGEETFSNEQELCELMKVKQLNMYGRNFVSLENDINDIGLSHTGVTLSKVYDEYKDYSEPEFRDVVIPILDLIIFKKWDNDNFNGIAKKEKLIEKERTKDEIKAKNLKLKQELINILDSYLFKVGEIVTLHKKGSPPDDIFDCIITKGGILYTKPNYKRLDRNVDFEVQLNRNLYDIIFPHNLGQEYANIKIQ